MLQKWMFVGAIVLSLTGCKLEFGSALDQGYAIIRDGDAKGEALVREEFRLQLNQVVDHRPPAERAVQVTGHDKIYEYNADELLQGAVPYVMSVLRQDLRVGGQGDVHLMLDVEIDSLRTWITRGNFWDGSYGRYKVDAVFTVTVRDGNSGILLREELAYDDSKRRAAYRGHHPTTTMDKDAFKALIDDVLNRLSIDSGWLVHRMFNETRKYHDNNRETFQGDFNHGTEDLHRVPLS